MAMATLVATRKTAAADPPAFLFGCMDANADCCIVCCVGVVAVAVAVAVAVGIDVIVAWELVPKPWE